MWMRMSVSLSLLVLTAIGASAQEGTVKLPQPDKAGRMTLEAAISRRRSMRSYESTALTMKELGQVLWSAQGITDEQRGLRAAPSAGALYPLEIYVAAAEGLFKYRPHGHALEVTSEKDLRSALARACVNQRWMARAGAHIIITAAYGRTARKYGERAKLYVPIEAGAVCENVSLQAVALGLGTCTVGAFEEAELSRILGLPDSETPLLVMTIGKPGGK